MKPKPTVIVGYALFKDDKPVWQESGHGGGLVGSTSLAGLKRNQRDRIMYDRCKIRKVRVTVEAISNGK